MQCAACGSENRPGARFCNGCGAALAAACASCGQSNPPGSRFCDSCGQPLTAQQRTPEPASAPIPASPQSYTPQHLAQKILAGRDALAGERKQVTVLFADVVGSTELIRDRDPEDAQRLLDGAVQRMMEAVHRYEGTVSRLMGDGLMAMFGAPVAHEDHAVRACYAALAMQQAISTYAEQARRVDGAAIQIRVGLNSGEVVVRLVSDDLHMDYTAMGQTVHLAARMEGLANAGAVLLSPAALALVEGYVEVRPLGPMPVKGLEQPIEVNELVGAGTARTRLQASAARGLTPFVGRQEERAAIGRALARAQAGQGQVVALVAEAGVGKSRLVWETTHSDRASSFGALQTGALSYGQTTAWLPVSDLLRRYFQIDGRDDHTAMREKVAAGMHALDPALAPDLPALLALLDLPVEDAAWDALDPRQRRIATLDALQRLLLSESQRQPLLLVVEDLHWLDSETQALLDGLVEALPTARILLLVNYRPEYTHTWGNKSYYTQLRVDPLGQVIAERMLDALLGHDPTVQPLKALLIARTEGNPFFLEEGIRSLMETGALVGERGAYCLVRAVADVRVPATVQAVLAARIDRLPAEDKRLLQTAAVIGKDVPFVLLEAIAGTPDSELRGALSRLQAAELLYPVSLFPSYELTFKHALTHDVAYDSLLQERRKTVHGQIVDAIERLYPDRLDEHVERLAHHAVRGESGEKAARYARAAGGRAADRSAFREAVSWFERALERARRLPENRDARVLALDLCFDLRMALGWLAEYTRALEYLHEGEAIAEALGDLRRQSGICARKIECLRAMARFDEAEVAGHRAVRLAEQAGDGDLRTNALSELGQHYFYRGYLRQAADTLRACVQAPVTNVDLRHLGVSRNIHVQSRHTLAGVLGQLGDFDEAIAYGIEALRLSEAGADRSTGINAHTGVGRVYLERGDVTRALALVERARELAQTVDSMNHRIGTPVLHGACLVLAGQTATAISLLEEGMALSRASGVVAWTAYLSSRLAEAYLADGRISDARRSAMTSLTHAEARQEPAVRAVALRLLGESAASDEAPDFGEAEGRYRASLTQAEALEMRPLQAHCHLGLGKLYRRLGRLEEARSELSIAITMLREMGMTFWLPEAETELAAASASVPASGEA